MGLRWSFRVSETRIWVDVSVSSSIVGSKRVPGICFGAAVVLRYGTFMGLFCCPKAANRAATLVSRGDATSPGLAPKWAGMSAKQG